MDLSCLAQCADFNSVFCFLFRALNQPDVLILPAYSSLLQVDLATFRELFPKHRTILFIGRGAGAQPGFSLAGCVQLLEPMLSTESSLSAQQPAEPIFFYPMPQDVFAKAKPEWKTTKASWFFVSKEAHLFSEMAKIVQRLLAGESVIPELKTEEDRLNDVKMRIYLLMWLTSLPKTMPMYTIGQTVLAKWLKAAVSAVCTSEWNVLHLFRKLDIPLFLRPLDDHAKASLFSPLQPLTKYTQQSFSLLDWHPRSQLIGEWQKNDVPTVHVELDGRLQRIEYAALPLVTTQARNPNRPCALHLFSTQCIDLDTLTRSLVRFLYSVGHPIYNQLTFPLLEWSQDGIATFDVEDGGSIYMLYSNQLLFINAKVMYTFLQHWLAFATNWSFLRPDAPVLIKQPELYQTPVIVGPIPKRMVLNVTSLIVLEQLRQEKPTSGASSPACMFELITPDVASVYPPQRARKEVEDETFCSFEYSQARILLLDRCKFHLEEINYDYWESLGLSVVAEQARTKVSSVLAPTFQRHMRKMGGQEDMLRASIDHRQIESDILVDAVNFLETTLGLTAQVFDGGATLRFRDNVSLLVNVEGRFRGSWVDFAHHNRETGKTIARLLQHLNIVSSHAEASQMMKNWVDANGLSLQGRTDQIRKQSAESLREREEKTLESVRAHWMNASPLSHQSSRVGRNYFRNHRGFAAAAPRRLIEDNPSLFFRTMSYSQGGKVVAHLPTVLALAYTEDNRLCTFERIFLDEQTHKKTSLGLTKKTYSSLHMGGYPGAQHRQAFFCASKGDEAATENGIPKKVIIAEGVEDALTLSWAHPKYPVHAVIGKGNFAKFCLYRSAELYICLDNDDEQDVQNLKNELSSRKSILKSCYKEISFIRCPTKYKDYNEMLQAEGIENVRASVKEQVGD